MSLKFSQLETNLRRAGVTLLVMVLVGILLVVVLPFFGLDRGLALLFVWIANLPAVWFLAMAARHQQRNPWVTGFISLPPLIAVVNFWLMWSIASAHQSNPSPRQ
jgi:hypothetical protein